MPSDASVRLIYQPVERVIVRVQLGFVETEFDTRGECLVAAPTLYSAERDGYIRYAQCTASIVAPQKRDVAGLSRFVAAWVPFSALKSGECFVEHQFVRLDNKLINSEAAVPEGWSPAPAKCGRGSRFELNEAERIEALSMPEVQMKPMAAFLDKMGFGRREGEEDWRFAQRARHFVSSRIKFDWESPKSLNINKGLVA